MIYRLYALKTNIICLDCFVPRNDGDTYRHCEERSNPEDNMNNAGKVPQGQHFINRRF